MQISKNKIVIALIIVLGLVVASAYFSLKLPAANLKESYPTILTESAALSSYEVAESEYSLLAGPNYMGCNPTEESNNKCSLYSIARLNEEKYDVDIPNVDDEIKEIAHRIADRLKAQHEPFNPPRSWAKILEAKKYVMKTGPNPILGPNTPYQNPQIFDLGRDGRPGGESQDILTPARQLVSGGSSPSTQNIVITVKWNDGTVHSMFCYVTNLVTSRKHMGNGHYVCHDHIDQGGFTYILDIEDEKVTGEKIEPYPGPGVPLPPIVSAAGALTVLIIE